MERRRKSQDGTEKTTAKDDPASAREEADYAQSRLAALRDDDARLRQLFDVKLLSALMMLALVLSLETAAFSYAVTAGLAERLELTGLRLAALFAAPCVLQVPLQMPAARYLADRFPLAILAAPAMVVCGNLFNFAGHVGAGGLLRGRVAQGVFEAGIMVPVVSKTLIYWSREEVPVRMSAWFSMTGLTTVVS